MPEISSVQPARPMVASPATGQALSLRLLQSLPEGLVVGQSSEAEIIRTQPATPGQPARIDWQVTLDSGRQVTLSTQADSGQLPELGTRYRITLMPDQQLVASLQPATRQPATRLDSQVFPPETRLQAEVMASQPAGKADGQAIFESLARLVGQTADSPRLLLRSLFPLAPGSLLTLRVQSDQQLALIPPSTRLDQLAINQQLGSQFNRQGSLDSLLDHLQDTAQLPPAVRPAASQLLALLPGVQELGDPARLADLLRNSGLFLESSLGKPRNGQNPLPQDDLKAGLLRLIARLLPDETRPATRLPDPPQARQAGQRPEDWQMPARPQATDFPLPGRLHQAPGQDITPEALLKLATAAIARLQTHQLSSLAQTRTTPEGNQLNTWQLEIPMQTDSHIVPLQLWLQQENTNPEARRTAPAVTEAIWRLELAFDLPPLGPLQVMAQLASGTVSSQLWAEQPETLQLIEQELGQLRERLGQLGLAVGELCCHPGRPPRGPRTVLEQRMIDERA